MPVWLGITINTGRNFRGYILLREVCQSVEIMLQTSLQIVLGLICISAGYSQHVKYEVNLVCVIVWNRVRYFLGGTKSIIPRHIVSRI